MLHITPRLGELDSPDISIEDIASFYSIDGVAVSDTRPYTWTNSVTTLDGIIHFGDESMVGDVALKNVPGIGHWSEADWRLLNAGWAHADAVLITGEILRKELNAGCIVRFDDLINYRMTSLGKATRQPIQIVLSTMCDFSIDRPLFLGLEGASDGSDTDPLQVWVVTTSLGAAALEHRMQPYRNSGQLRSVVKIIVGEDVSVNAATADSTNVTLQKPMIDFVWLFNLLRRDGIRYLDVSAGGSVIRKCIDLGLLNETRLTLAGHVAGPFDMGGNMRPGLFPVDSDRFKSYGPDRSPLLAMRALRMGGDHLMFVRGEWTYR
ncbi:hypothetical protein BASA62_008395 [Batrachochytrium salamandrivorans]|nr:hypothetical protein BASA62_008395 [Batrachochytrium salamandrivorans]